MAYNEESMVFLGKHLDNGLIVPIQLYYSYCTSFDRLQVTQIVGVYANRFMRRVYNVYYVLLYYVYYVSPALYTL